MVKFIRISLYSLFVSSLFMFNSSFAATIALPGTGQTACYDANGTVISCAGTGQDGDKLKGVAAPSPRFTDNANGTVTDRLTGLIWLKNANCFSTQIWGDAITKATTLASGACGLSDGSTAGQWRLPNRKELMSLVDRSKLNPALSTSHPFTTVQSNSDYWSSSSGAGDSDFSAWIVSMVNGRVGIGNPKSNGYYVWPVRAGQ